MAIRAIGRSLAVVTVLVLVGAVNAAVALAADTTPPTAPRHLSAGSTSSQVSLFWGRSGDDVGVAAYHVERCNGAGCRNFGEIGTATSTAFVDSGLATGATYRYRVRAS